MDLYIDLKNFPVYLSKAALVIAVQREVRGAYRARGQGLDEAYVVVRKDMKTNTGAKSIRIAGGVGKGRVRLWDAILGKWNANAAAALYSGPICNSLRRVSPGERSYLLLEDNDPSGFK